VLLGTPDYLAPEQARDPRNIDIRADIYSLGSTLYHLLTGQPPFPDKNILNQMIRHATETPKPLQHFNATIPEGLSQIVEWMIAKQPAQRYPTPGRAAQALDVFLLVTSEPAKPAEDTPQLRKFLTWLDMSDKQDADADKTIPPPAFPKALVAPPLKPASSPHVPVASAKPEASARRRKKRTGVKMPPTAAIPAALPAPPSVPMALPILATPTAPAPGPFATGDDLDVELVDVPDVSPSRQASRLRDILMIGMGIVGMLIFYGLWTLVSLILRWTSGD
jgi:serine/threonine protein kinase